MAEWSGVLAWRRFSGRATAVDMDLDRPAGAFGRVLALAADCESPWPLDWLATPMLEGCNFWQVADDRWQVLDDLTADEEEARVLDKWVLTAETMMHVDDWKKLFAEVGYTGDYWCFIAD